MTFICEYCNTNFSRKGNLKRHINSIHELINFRCERCEFTTTRKDKLREHIISKHYQKIFKCLKCSAEFSRNDNLARHMKNHVDLSIRVLEQLCKDINSGKDETSIYKCKDTHSRIRWVTQTSNCRWIMEENLWNNKSLRSEKKGFGNN